ncbi:MAG TPA: hypothetical protein VHL78_14035 [Actinomycetota bacterium]|nr:hypothetical protein [Actinomycetota bacterium]
MEQPPAARRGFDLSRLTMGSKALLASGLVLFVALFLPWRTVKGCEATEAIVGDLPCSESGFAGLGVLVAILVIGLLVWEGVLAAGVAPNVGTASPALVSAGIGAAAALFGLIKFLMSLGGGPIDAFSVAWGAFVGLLAAVALGYASYLRYRESRAGAPPRGSPGRR